MQVNGCRAVCFGNFLIVHFRQPVVGGDCTAVGKDESSHGVGYRGILLNTPVGNFEVVVHHRFVVQNGFLGFTHVFVLLAVQNVRFGNVGVTCLNKYRFHAVLNVFHGNDAVGNLVHKVRRNFQCKHVDDVLIVGLLLCFKCLGDCVAYFGKIEVNYLTVSLFNLIRVLPPVACGVPQKKNLGSADVCSIVVHRCRPCQHLKHNILWYFFIFPTIYGVIDITLCLS